MVVILDYGLGNLSSVFNVIQRIRHDVIISRDPEIIRNCTHLIIPGVGSFDYGVKNLTELDLVILLQEIVEIGRIKILGICLGFQLMCLTSEEGLLKGLGWIPVTVIRFPFEEKKSSYNMNWLTISEYRNGFNYFNGDRFYYTHGFFVPVTKNTLLSAHFKSTEFTAFYRSGNLFGAQFHPEKSSVYGLKFFKYFFDAE
jgi:glutamine amidotransferase